MLRSEQKSWIFEQIVMVFKTIHLQIEFWCLEHVTSWINSKQFKENVLKVFNGSNNSFSSFRSRKDRLLHDLALWNTILTLKQFFDHSIELFDEKIMKQPCQIEDSYSIWSLYLDRNFVRTLFENLCKITFDEFSNFFWKWLLNPARMNGNLIKSVPRR